MHLGRFGFGLPQRASGVAEAEEAQRRAASRWAFCRTLAGDDYLPPIVLGGCSIEALQPCRFV